MIFPPGWFLTGSGGEAKTEEEARKELDTLSDRLYANPVIEDWDYDLKVIENFPKGISNV